MGCDKTNYTYLSLPFLGRAYIETNSVVKPPKFCHIERIEGEYFIWIGKTHIVYTPPTWCSDIKKNPIEGGLIDVDGSRTFHGRE